MTGKQLLKALSKMTEAQLKKQAWVEGEAITSNDVGSDVALSFSEPLESCEVAKNAIVLKTS